MPKNIDLINVKITNQTSEAIIVNDSHEFFLWLPGLIDASYTEGGYAFVDNNEVIEIPPNDYIFVNAKILNTDRFFNYYKSNECSITLWLSANNKLYSTNTFRFSKEEFRKYYVEFVID